MSTARRVFQLMAKPSGAICNLDCDYCFFLSKEQLYPGSPFRMDDEVLSRYVEQLLGRSSRSGGGHLRVPRR